MASISSLTSSSSSSSIYGTRNVISGLASGLDTETLIQNAVSGYETKISGLNQKRTKLEWQQEAFRNIITKMSNFSSKYTSYTSSTNLRSSSFFNNAVKVNSLGEYSDKVSASGKTSSDVKLLGVKQLATSASYTVSGGALGNSSQGAPSIEGSDLDLSKTYEKSLITGNLTLGYGGSTKVTISFDEDDICKSGEDLANKINEKLADQTISFTQSGTSAAASERIEAKWDSTNQTIRFEEKGNAGNTVTVLGASGDLKSTLGIGSYATSDGVKTIDLSDKTLCDEDATYADILKEEEISFTLDGKTKKISLAEYDFSGNSTLEAVQNALQEELNSAFGEGKITVDANSTKEGLKFEVAKGSTLKIDNGKALGLESNSETSYANTSKKLGDLLIGFDWTNTETMAKAVGDITAVAATSKTDAYLKDADGNRVAKHDDGNYYRVDEDGNWLHSLEINGEQVGAFSKETALESVMTTINGNDDVNVSLSYSKTTNQFKFTAKESGETGNIRIQDGLAGALFGNTIDENGSYVEGYVEGQDAVFSLSVNGEELTDISRSSNSFEIDGLTLNLKGTFGYEADNRVKVAEGVYEAADSGRGSITINGYDKNGNVLNNLVLDFKYVNDDGEYVTEDGTKYTDLVNIVNLPTGEFKYEDAEGNPITDVAQQTSGNLIRNTEAVTFETEADADTIVDAIKSMVEEYNAMVKEIKDAYSTLPLENSSGDAYEPLTDDDKADMSDSAIEAYEEKAKTGLLFGDRDLSNLYSRLTNAVQSVGLELESIGISTSYDDGLTTLSLNESKLRSVLETDPDKVQEAFTRSKSSGASTDGLMEALKTPLDMYGSTTGATKGILVEKAGSPLAPTTIYQNYIQNQLDALDTQIESWQDKLSDKIDYYTSKFTQLETLINEMNSQSSALASLSGSY